MCDFNFGKFSLLTVLKRTPNFECGFNAKTCIISTSVVGGGGSEQRGRLSNQYGAKEEGLKPARKFWKKTAKRPIFVKKRISRNIWGFFTS